MTNELKNTVKFHVDLNTNGGLFWTQEFIKPLVNCVSNFWYDDKKGKHMVLNSGEDDMGYDGDEVNIVSVYDLFTDEVEQTLNTYGAEQGWGYDLTVADIPKGKLSVCIGVTPLDNYHNGECEVGFFDFHKDRLNGTEEWKEVEQILSARIEKILKGDGFVLKEVA